LKLVHEVAQANLGIPIIGIGGIRNLTDVLDFFECGADAVQIGTATFVEPDTMTNIINGLRKHMVKENINSIAELKKRM
jgi:dihydroorotate dehydrogenase (NAD+) catalytic subunit